LTGRNAATGVGVLAPGSAATPTDNATAISFFRRADDRAGFLDWAGQLDLAVRSFSGFMESQLATPEAPIFDWALAVRFRSESELHQWLDSPARGTLLNAGARAGIVRISTDVVLTDGTSPPTGLGIFQHTVMPGKTADFVAVQTELVDLSSAFSGFEGGTLLPPAATAAGSATESSRQDATQWLSILRFRTDHQLQAWLNSSQRRDALPELRSQLTGDFSVITHSTPFGSILRIQDGTTKVTPNWKTAMLVLLVLYPTVMTLSRFLGPVLDNLGAEPWLSMWLSQIVSVGLMTWFFMPAVTGWFRRWLDPVDGAAPRISLIGAAIVVVVYVATLALFASVNWLQFWDYID
jgi:antibiotic biosynthesis monooxygenase (ABM) superfamily enzyme